MIIFMSMRRAVRTITTLTAALAVALSGTAGGGAGTARADAARPQLLFYNHSYAVLDRATADAVEHSTYLRAFSDFEVRTTTGGGLTWKGRYLKGRETYIEFFSEGDLPGQDALFGSSGLALSVENQGELATVTDRLKAQGISDPAEYDQTRDFGDGVPVPWFDTIRTTGQQYDAFDPWAMEYRPEYFADPRSQTEPASHEGDVGRERYLPDGYRDHQMRDITAIELAVPERDLTNTVPLLKAGGFTLRKLPDGVVAVSGGTRIELHGVPRERAGMRRVEMSLNRPMTTRHTERIGNSTLVAGPGAHAVWTFDSPR